MIRTRDFVLFVVVVLFLLSGISGTLVRDQASSPEPVSVALQPGMETEGAAATPVATIDYEANRERLLARMRESSVTIEPAPSVTTDADTARVTATTSDSNQVTAGPQYCLYPDDTLPYIGRWPLTGADVAVLEGARIAYTDTTATLSETGSSSLDTERIRTVFLTLPINPQRTSSTNCLPSEVVGVTPAGILIFNNDVRSYRGLQANQLVGYARDGFPIYGPYDGETDVCGGYAHPAGYRYTVGTDRDYLIGCYQGAPQPFTFQ